MTMPATLQALDVGSGMYRLHAGDGEIGWVAGIALGFRGFASEQEAVQGAQAAHAAVAAWLARQRRRAPAPLRSDALRLSRADGRAELTLGDVVVGWVVPMGGVGPGSATEFAFELRLPDVMDHPALALAAARAVHAALERRRAVRHLASAEPERRRAAPVS